MDPRKTTIQVSKVVYIGNRPPTTRFVAGFADPAKRFIDKADLYQPKNRDQKRRG